MAATLEANGVALGIECFGRETDPLVLLAGGTTMLSWPDSLCEALAATGDGLSPLTLFGTRPVAPGPVDEDLPDHDAAVVASAMLAL